jgi:hypothetical protein
MATTPAVENLDWTFEQLSRLEKIDRLVAEAIEQASVAGRGEFPKGSYVSMIMISLLDTKHFIDADLATVPASMRPEVESDAR